MADSLRKQEQLQKIMDKKQKGREFRLKNAVHQEYQNLIGKVLFDFEQMEAVEIPEPSPLKNPIASISKIQTRISAINKKRSDKKKSANKKEITNRLHGDQTLNKLISELSKEKKKKVRKHRKVYLFKYFDVIANLVGVNGPLTSFLESHEAFKLSVISTSFQLAVWSHFRLDSAVKLTSHLKAIYYQNNFKKLLRSPIDYSRYYTS